MALAAASPWGISAFVPATGLRGQSKVVNEKVEHFTAEPELDAGVSGQNRIQSATMVAGLVGSACILARRKPALKKTSVKATFDKELGVTAPFKYWDPLGMASGDEAEFRRRRVAEIKNGRVAMWACMGYIVPEYFRWPGYCSPSQDLKFTDIPNGVDALYKVPVEGWAQIGIFIAFLELFPLRQEKDRVPGDAPGCGRLGVPWFLAFNSPGTECDTVKSERSLNAEINNGRLAMVAITGMVFQNCMFGTTGPAMWGFGSGAFENELGVQPPVGFWDPLGFCDDGDEFDFRRRRCVEIKHGRVSMLACIGYIVPEYFKWPGYLSPSTGLKFSDVPHGLAAITKVPAVGWMQIVFFGLAMELFAMNQSPKDPPGKLSSRLVFGLTDVNVGINQYTWGPFGIPNAPPIEDPEVKKRKLNAEIANGRLAMFAIMAMMFQNGTVGTTGPEMWLPAAAEDTKLRAFENELGVQPPVGFWDPLGFCDDGDEFDFRRRRCVEIKHGRVSMLACIGYIVPEYFKWPGYLSPSTGLKFSDVPHGLAAITKVPAVGWMQIVFFGLAMELFAMNQNAKDPPGKLSSRLVFGLTDVNVGINQYTWGPFGIPNAPPIEDPEVRKRKLNAEIANGRLAMFAIMAMMFQNGTVGTTGPEMWLPPAP